MIKDGLRCKVLISVVILHFPEILSLDFLFLGFAFVTFQNCFHRTFTLLQCHATLSRYIYSLTH